MLSSVLFARTGGTEPMPRAMIGLTTPQKLPGAAPLAEPRPAEPASAPMTERRSSAWASNLPTLTVENPNSRGVAAIKLYADDGTVDPAAFESLRKLVGVDGIHPAPMNRRVVQLMVKAAAHFGAEHVVIVSAYRPGRRGGPHAHGVAIDFKLAGTGARALAAYLRTFPRVGVGIYTHPGTQFVHLDVRETSWHWVDGSPPGRTWREVPLQDPSRAARDAMYTPDTDLP
jgi:uncharacterized protein YcbK (DUF882 family)